MKKISKKVSIGVLAAVVVATPMVAISCGENKDSRRKEDDERQKSRKREAELKAKKEEAKKEAAEKEALAKAAKEKEEKEKNKIQSANLRKLRKAFSLLDVQDSDYWIKRSLEERDNTLTAEELIKELSTTVRNEKNEKIQFVDGREAIHFALSQTGHFNLPVLDEGSTLDMTYELEYKKDDQGEEFGRITIKVNLHTPGATNPDAGEFTYGFDWLTKSSIENNKFWAEKSAREAKEEAEKWKKEVARRVAEKKAKGFVPIGDTYEVWYDKKNQIIEDEWGKYTGDRTADLEHKRDRYNGVFDDQKKYPIKIFKMNYITEIDGTGIRMYGTDFTFPGAEVVEMKHLRTVHDRSFRNWANLRTVIMPNLINMEHGFHYASFGWNEVTTWDLSEAKEHKFGWDIHPFINSPKTVVILNENNEDSVSDWVSWSENRGSGSKVTFDTLKITFKIRMNGKDVEAHWVKDQTKNTYVLKPKTV
ncbi:hypothetical protein [Mycoplasma todarodis]|uniref:Lipoprotein n=1 Tax=Mycoplasma todarodis TaxID=1937191 RepID=A0A4R0XUA1_9MOLU|nr:hypothetical protein [Mycoplasma todarodis]TCG12118.1 hypothetical protein C4B25_00285 [Mycoplasma todarodis]